MARACHSFALLLFLAATSNDVVLAQVVLDRAQPVEIPEALARTMYWDDDNIRSCFVEGPWNLDIRKYLEAKVADINGDGHEDFLIRSTRNPDIPNCTLCGRWRCFLWVYERMGEEKYRLLPGEKRYRLLLHVQGIDKAELLSSSTNGFRDIKIVYPPGIDYPAVSEVHRFTGKHYESSATPPPELLTSPEGRTDDAMRRIVKGFQEWTKRRDIERPVSYSTDDWPSTVKSFARIDRGGIPVLTSPILSEETLSLVAITKGGEILALLEKRQITMLFNPLGGGASANGIWLRVQLLNGQEGWLYGGPTAQKLYYVTLIEPRNPTEFLAIAFLAGCILLLIWRLFGRTKKDSTERPSRYSDHEHEHEYGGGDYAAIRSSSAKAQGPSDSVNVEEYRRGYEDGRSAGPLSQLGDALLAVLDTDDYTRGYVAGHQGKDFDPYSETED